MGERIDVDFNSTAYMVKACRECACNTFLAMQWDDDDQWHLICAECSTVATMWADEQIIFEPDL